MVETTYSPFSTPNWEKSFLYTSDLLAPVHSSEVSGYDGPACSLQLSCAGKGQALEKRHYWTQADGEVCRSEQVSLSQVIWSLQLGLRPQHNPLLCPSIPRWKFYGGGPSEAVRYSPWLGPLSATLGFGGSQAYCRAPQATFYSNLTITKLTLPWLSAPLFISWVLILDEE